MSLINLFTGPTAEKLEAQGDRFLASGQWGQAKLAYERALVKLEKSAAATAEPCRRLESKIQQAREALAREHREHAMSYRDGGYMAEARESLRLALEISQDPLLRENWTAELAALEDGSEASGEPVPETMAAALPVHDPDARQELSPSRGEHFQALCNTLPEAVAGDYQNYGEDFVDGYLALNSGDFERAADCLERALAAFPQDDSYIRLELATAYLNSDRLTEAHSLLEQFRSAHPEALPAYQLLCEIHWEQRDFVAAHELLGSLPADLAQSRAGILLKGETLCRAGDFSAARDFYRGFLAAYGWDPDMTLALAKAHEALNEQPEARRLYREIIQHSRGCRTRVDAPIRYRFAELSFAQGDRGEEILELYLALAGEVPEHAATCFDRISRIYVAQGNDAEGRRFRDFARRAQAEQTPTPP